MNALLVHLRVTPGAARPRIGGRWGDGEPPHLIVAVRARAVDGAANRAIEAAVAEAWGVRPRDVSVVKGGRSRSKTVRIDGDPDRLADRFVQLLAAGSQ